MTTDFPEPGFPRAARRGVDAGKQRSAHDGARRDVLAGGGAERAIGGDRIVGVEDRAVFEHRVRHRRRPVFGRRGLLRKRHDRERGCGRRTGTGKGVPRPGVGARAEGRGGVVRSRRGIRRVGGGRKFRLQIARETAFGVRGLGLRSRRFDGLAALQGFRGRRFRRSARERVDRRHQLFLTVFEGGPAGFKVLETPVVLRDEDFAVERVGPEREVFGKGGRRFGNHDGFRKAHGRVDENAERRKQGARQGRLAQTPLRGGEVVGLGIQDFLPVHAAPHFASKT